MDTKFISSDFFICHGLLNYTIGTLEFHQISLHNIEILNNSNIFFITNIESLIITSLSLTNSHLKDNS